MTRVVVHIGSQHVASMAIPQGIFANVEVLARHGVLVPQTGRHELSPAAVRHHGLAWSLAGDEGPTADPDIWRALSEEIAASSASTVLISSELLAAVAMDEQTGPLLRQRLYDLSDDVIVAFIAREQLGLLNRMYCQRVRALELTCDFDGYLEQTDDLALYRLTESLSGWFDDARIRFVAMPWEDQRPDAEALPALLALTGVDVATQELVAGRGATREDLGAVGIEATRLLTSYLRGRFPDFTSTSAAARRLRRRASAMADDYEWCTGDFWGWHPTEARSVVDRYAQSNEAFALRAWGGSWNLTAPVDRQRHVVELPDVTATDANRLHHYLAETTSAYRRLLKQEAAA